MKEKDLEGTKERKEGIKGKDVRMTDTVAVCESYR